MAGRRITYLALLIAAAVLHLVYGQYITHYMVLFLLCVPVLSLIVSIPSAIGARVQLMGGEDVLRGRKSRVRLFVKSSSFMPPEGWSITVESQNLFTGVTTSSQKVRLGAVTELEQVFSPDTSQLGSIRYRIKRAFVFDHLGLIPIPVKKGGSVAIIVFPDREKPVPEPDLIEGSARALRPKPMGFAEEHELRPYRDGDPLNLIHWKLTRKHDEYIVREPQEVVRKDIILVIDPPTTYERHRSVLEQLDHLNSKLAEHEIPYLLQYGQRSFYIDSANDYDEFLRIVLSNRMKCENAVTPENGTEALVYRIRPGKGAMI